MVLIVCFRARYGCYPFSAKELSRYWQFLEFILLKLKHEHWELYQLPNNMLRVKVYFLSLHIYCITSSSSCVSHSSVGTFARALDCSSSVRQPSLHMSAAAASRDITLVRYTWKRPWVESASHHRWKVYGRGGGRGAAAIIKENVRRAHVCVYVCVGVCVSVSDRRGLCLVIHNKHLAPEAWCGSILP